MALWVCLGQPGWAITHSHLTHIVIINHPFLLPSSITIYRILPVQSTCSTVFFQNLFTQSLSYFCITCPYHRNPFCCSLSLNPLLTTLFCSLMPHIHLTMLISALWGATSFSFLTGQVSLPCMMQHTTSYTTAVQSPYDPIHFLLSSAFPCTPSMNL